MTNFVQRLRENFHLPLIQRKDSWPRGLVLRSRPPRCWACHAVLDVQRLKAPFDDGPCAVTQTDIPRTAGFLQVICISCEGCLYVKTCVNTFKSSKSLVFARMPLPKCGSCASAKQRKCCSRPEKQKAQLGTTLHGSILVLPPGTERSTASQCAKAGNKRE